MADYRRTRDYQPDAPLELQYLNDPSYTPLDRIGGPGMGGAGNEGSFNSPAIGGIEGNVDRIQQESDIQRGLLGQLASLRQQGQGGGGMDLGGMWEGLKGAGSQGMDMLGRGLNAITPSQDTVNNIAMRLQNAHAIGTGQTPLYMMQQQHQMAMGQHQELMAQRRQQMAMQLGQLQEQKRGHDLQLLEKALASPRAGALLEQLGQDPNYGMAQQAAMLHKGLKDSDYGSFSAYREFIPEDVQQRFMQGQLPQHELAAWIDEARLSAKEDAKFKAKDAILTRAMNKPADQRTPREMQLVEEHQAELELKKMKPRKTEAEIQEKETQSTLNTSHAQLYDWQREHGGAGVQDMGNDREAAALRLYGKRYVMLDPSQMKRVDDAAAQFMGQTQGYKSTAVQQAQLQVPDKLTDAEREKTVGDVSTLDLLDRMGKSYSPDWVGPVRGRGGAIMEKYSGMPGIPEIGEDEAKFRADVATLRNKVIKEITGAQMSEPEANRIREQTPEATNPDPVFRARLQSTRENLKQIAKRRREILEKTGADTSSLPALGKKKQGTAPAQAQSGLPQVKTPADWEQLAPGTEYIDPNGKRKRKR